MSKKISKTVSGFVEKHRNLVYETFFSIKEKISFEYKVESYIVSKTTNDALDKDEYQSSYSFDVPSDFVDVLLAQDILENLQFYVLDSVQSLNCEITTTIHLPEHLGQDIVFGTVMYLENEDLVELMEHKFHKLSFETVFCLESKFSSNVLSDKLTIIPV